MPGSLEALPKGTGGVGSTSERAGMVGRPIKRAGRGW